MAERRKINSSWQTSRQVVATGEVYMIPVQLHLDSEHHSPMKRVTTFRVICSHYSNERCNQLNISGAALQHRLYYYYYKRAPLYWQVSGYNRQHPASLMELCGISIDMETIKLDASICR